MAAFPTLKIGNLTIDPLHRLPDSKFTSAPVRTQTTVRTQTGRLVVQRQYTKYSVQITGLAQTLYEDLRYLNEQDAEIDLYSIANRKEVLTITGLTQTYFLTRRVRQDEDVVSAVVEWPEGTALAASTWSILNGSTNATLTFGSVLPAGTNAVVRYFPILGGYITEFDSDYDYVQDEESWTLTFDET